MNILASKCSLVGKELPRYEKIEFHECKKFNTVIDFTKNEDGSFTFQIPLLVNHSRVEQVTINPPKPTKRQEEGREPYIILELVTQNPERLDEVSSITLLLFYLYNESLSSFLRESFRELFWPFSRISRNDKCIKDMFINELIWVFDENDEKISQVARNHFKEEKENINIIVYHLLSRGYFLKCNGKFSQPYIKELFERYNPQDIIDIFKQRHLGSSPFRLFHSISRGLDPATAIKFLENPEAGEFLKKNLGLFYANELPSINPEAKKDFQKFIESFKNFKDFEITNTLANPQLKNICKNRSIIVLQKPITQKIAAFLVPNPSIIDDISYSVYLIITSPFATTRQKTIKLLKQLL